MTFFFYAVNQSTTPNLLNQLNLTPADLSDVTDVVRAIKLEWVMRWECGKEWIFPPSGPWWKLP